MLILKLFYFLTQYSNKDIHRDTEEMIAKFHDAEDCMLYSSLFLGNAILITIATKRDLIISDSENHASLIYASRLSPAKRLIYKTQDMEGKNNPAYIIMYLDNFNRSY